MPTACTILIAAADLLPLLKDRAGSGPWELLAFTDTEALKALETITRRKPGLVALERQFSATPRGAALINRIKADPSLVECEVVIVTDETDFSRLESGRTSEAGPRGGSGVAVATAPAAVPAKPLDQTGTRRAPRFRIAGSTDILLDGTSVALIDLSVIGAQVVSATVLKPNQRVRISLGDEQGVVRVRAFVAWASFEIPSGGSPQYRAGLEFIDASSSAVEAYCSRHTA